MIVDVLNGDECQSEELETQSAHGRHLCEVGLPLTRKKRTTEAADMRAESVLDPEGIRVMDDKIET